jgi:PKHD-type hydroxylase
VLIGIKEVLAPVEAELLREAATALDFDDGRKTAGAFAALVKANDQAAASPALDAILAQVTRALSANALFTAAARPRLMSRLILSRYRVGQTYGLHVDDALMQGMRTDLSFTLFLAPPDSYEGGALIIEDMFEARAIKLGAGDMILYPSTTLHRVEPVTAGERIAIVGWVQSHVRQADQREVLFDLDQTIAELHARDGKTPVLDSLTKTRSNLIRMWAD